MSEWQTIGQAGFWGSERRKKESELNRKYGTDNWRIIHVWGKAGETVIPKTMAVELYGDAYYEFLKYRRDIREYLRKEARDVYVYEEQDVVQQKQQFPDTLDYTIQEIEPVHLQDIAVRRAFIRLGIWFEGRRLLCIRGGSDDSVGNRLSPGKIPFHLPEKIYMPHLTDWWNENSVACYYHSNKLLQVKQDD